MSHRTPFLYFLTKYYFIQQKSVNIYHPQYLASNHHSQPKNSRQDFYFIQPSPPELHISLKKLFSNPRNFGIFFLFRLVSKIFYKSNENGNFDSLNRNYFKIIISCWDNFGKLCAWVEFKREFQLCWRE